MRDAPARSGAKNSAAAIFALSFGGYFLLILLPILRADRYCNDDLIRSLHGNFGWNNNGRHLTNLVMRALELGNQRLVDISPLPQLLAIAILAGIAVLIARRYAIRSPLIAALAAFPLGAQPFFLENLSYKFDAPCMALALLCALLPLLAIGTNRRGWALGVLSLLASLNLYQPAINAFLLFALLELTLAQRDETPLRGQVALVAMRASQVLVAVVVYQWLFGASLKDWMRDHGAIVHTFDQWAAVKANAGAFFAFAISAFSARWTLLFAPIALALALAPAIVGFRFALAARRERPLVQTIAIVALAILLPFLALVFVVGPMLLLEQPVLMPRVMMGVGAWLSIGLIAWHALLPSHPGAERLQLAAGAALALAFAVIAGTYGNAAAAQKQYEGDIASTLSNDIAEIAATRPLRAYLVVGSAGLAPVAAHAAEHVPLIDSLVLPYLRENDFNTRNFLLHYAPTLADAMADPKVAVDAALIRAQACAERATYVHRGYSLTLVDDIAVIRLSSTPRLRCDDAPDSATKTNVKPLQ